MNMNKDESYFLFTIHEDGDIYIREVEIESLLADLTEEGSGFEAEDFQSEFEGGDPNYWNKRQLLIKGKIVAPKPVQKVTEYKID